MKISYNWLKEYININIMPEKLAELLTMHSFEVENIIYQGEGLDRVVVGEVVKKKKHKNADKLSVVKVKIDNNKISEIVCGAQNVEVGQKVAVALLGAKLPCGLKIEKREIRGIESCGMICAEDELGLGNNHKGIMVLDGGLKTGTSLKEALSLDDVIFEIDILPNRAHDCLSHIGVAREVAAITKLEIGNWKFIGNWKLEIGNCPDLDIKIKNKNLCKRYSVAVIKNVKIKESPFLIKRRLESCGIRSINNIVDITNYVMLAIGQPMHAFDADKLNGKIIVRNAKRGEKILALNEEEYKLTENDLVIADDKNPIAIAGVIGGKETAVDEKTKNIIFEAANFECANIRKTSRRLKLSSESSYRFEREIDPEITTTAMMKAIRMAEDLTGGKMKGNITDIYQSPINKREIEFNFEKIKNLLGIEIVKKEIIRILKSLDFEISINKKNIKVSVPTYRIDIKKTNDIIEEIGRIYGYKNIYEVAPEVKIKSISPDKILLLEKDIRTISEGLGFCEVYNYSFVSEKDINNIGLKIEDHIELQNPLSEEHKFLRTSVLPYLLKNIKNNLKYKDEFMLFELGRIYLKSGDKLPNEKRIFAGIITDKNVKNSLFYEIKGRIDILLSKLGINKLIYQEIKYSKPFWHKGRSAEIVFQNKIIGRIGEIHPNVLNVFGIETRISYFEIYEEKILEFYSKEKHFQKINKFPSVEFDLSVIFDENVKWDDIKKAIFSADNNLIKNIQPFDVYRGKELGNGKKSIAFRISYQAEDRTLNDEEVGVIQNNIIKKLEKLGGKIRK